MKSLLTYLLLLLMLCPVPAKAQQANDNLQHIKLKRSHKKSVSAREIRQWLDEFENSSEVNFNFGFSPKPVWLSFQLAPQVARRPIILSFNYPPLDSVELFLLKGNKLLPMGTAGDMILHSDNFSNNYPSFELRPQNSSDTLVARVSTLSSNQFWLTVDTVGSFLNKSIINHTLYAVFYGILISMFMYNIFVFVVLKNTTYMYYSVYLVMQMLLFSSINGHLYEFVLKERVLMGNTITVLAISLLSIAGMVFTISFLKMRENSTKLYYAFMVMIAICAAVTLASLFISYQYTIKWASFLGALSAFLVLLAALYRYAKGYTPARFFVLSWTVYLISLILLVMQRFGILGTSFFIIHITEFGAIFETLLITLALIDQMQHIIDINKEYIIEIKSKAEQLQQKTYQLENHAYHLSHVLRKPIANILGLVNLMKEECNGEQKAIVERLGKSGEELDKIIKDEAKRLENN
ncbi:hypothetical protein GC194_14770 [bacterium]|nr:hypothetical protein [bacterium]